MLTVALWFIAPALGETFASAAHSRRRAVRPGIKETFNYREVVSGTSTLSLFAVATTSTGVASVNGLDVRRPTIPFQFDWGDGSVTRDFFPQAHQYSDLSRNYHGPLGAVTVRAFLAVDSQGNREGC